jgi:hypothetical protein
VLKVRGHELLRDKEGSYPQALDFFPSVLNVNTVKVLRFLTKEKNTI